MPVFVYVKAVKTEKSIAVRIDGGDRTMRFWDYVDDDYSDEDGVLLLISRIIIAYYVEYFFCFLRNFYFIRNFNPAYRKHFVPVGNERNLPPFTQTVFWLFVKSATLKTSCSI